MRKLRFCVISFIVFTNTLFAQQWIPNGGKMASMGFTSAAAVDFWTVNNNQAGMAFYEQNSVGVYYENRFLLKELSYQAIAATYKTHFGTLGANLNYSGDKNYNNLKAGIGYALKLGKNFAFGVQLDYLRVSLADIYKSNNKVSFEVGFIYKLTKDLTFGVHTFNPIPIKLANYVNEKIPTIINGGFSYTIKNNILVNIEAYKHSEFPLEIRTGAEYKIDKMFSARLGVCSKPFRYTFGVGIELNNFNIDLASCMHQTLGYSPQISLHYTFK